MDAKGYYVRKTKIVNGKTVAIDKWVSNMDEAKRYAKFLGGNTVIYPATNTAHITTQAQVWA